MFNRIIQLISFAFFLLALWLIGKEIKSVGLSNLWQMILSTPWWVIGLTLIATGLDFMVLCGYDVLALKYIHHKIPFLKIFEASGIGFAVSNTVGHSYVSGGAIRYLFYEPAGLNRVEILKLIAFETLTIFMGIGMAFIISVGIEPIEGISRTNHYFKTLTFLSLGIGIAFAFYDLLIVARQKIFHIGKIELNAPTQKMTWAQIGFGLLDNFCVFLAFFSILRYHLDIPFFETFSVFIIAQTIGLLTQVPGGLGVFESSFLYLFPHTTDEKSVILSSLVIFRVIYYFLPFALASCYLMIRYLFHHKKGLKAEK